MDTELLDAIRTVARMRPFSARLLLEDYIADPADRADEYEGAERGEREVLKPNRTRLHGGAGGRRNYPSAPKTVETYRARIMEKLNLCSRPDLVQYALAACSRYT